MHFRFMWLINYSIFNVIWTVGIFVTLLDYFVCGPFQNMLLPNSWDQDKEQTYTVFIKSVTDFYVTLKLYIKRFFKLRRTNSNLVIVIYLFEFSALKAWKYKVSYFIYVLLWSVIISYHFIIYIHFVLY